MTFGPNVGQFDRRVKFVGRGEGMTPLLTAAGIDVAVPDGNAGRLRTGVVRVRFGWTGASRRPGPKSSWHGEEQVKTRSNYFIGRNPRAWRKNVPHFARAVAGANGTERAGLAVYSSEKGVEYDLRLAPREDARKLRIRFSSATSLKIFGGDLIMDAGGRELRMGRPRVYDEFNGGGRENAFGEYLLEADGSVALRIAGHDPRATLVVDPSLSVAYSTFLGGAGNESAGSVAIDASGKVYVSGVTTSATTFPEPAATSTSPGAASPSRRRFSRARRQPLPWKSLRLADSRAP